MTQQKLHPKSPPKNDPIRAIILHVPFQLPQSTTWSLPSFKFQQCFNKTFLLLKSIKSDKTALQGCIISVQLTNQPTLLLQISDDHSLALYKDTFYLQRVGWIEINVRLQ